jgi:serine/threonine-protein kinase
MPPIEAEYWRRIQPILDRALELRPDERSSWLDTACAGEPALRADLDRLLAEDAAAGGVLDTSPHALLQLTLDDRDRPDTDGGGRFLPGVILANRYRVVSLLGRGGMGEVYRAHDLKLGQPVALKFLPTRGRTSPDRIEQLLHEARIARQVSHPNVCRVYDIGEAEGHAFLTMEYIDGEDLRSLLTRIGHLPRRKALDIARQLCAGLQAAHELGVLHRDLKPANVMLDARGRVRISDFGLAAATGDAETSELRAGTPAYMAPEQLDGRPASIRTDVYALGLVLYELFTGTRAFDAGDIEDLRRLQDASNPAKPSALVDGLDPVIERAILSCLEGDPALRPPSARAVAAALPGGDPIHTAIEAGETPAPELVAASGPEGSLRQSQAFGTLAAIFVMLGLLLLLSDRASVLGWVQAPRSADALEDHARGVLQRLDHTGRLVDSARSVIGFNDEYRRYVRAHDLSAGRWNVLRGQSQWDALFWYRQAPRVLMPWNHNSRVVSDDPAAHAGDAALLTDLRGRLIWLQVVPDEADSPVAGVTTPDWKPVFREAGLDLTRFQPTQPTRNPPVASDVRAAWTGTATDAGGYQIRVEAAAYRGKTVYFEQVVPWDRYWDPARVPASTRPLTRFDTTMFLVMSAMWLVVMPITVAMLVWRNWLSGRGDRRGAMRLATVIFCLRFTIWLLGGHHVPSLRQEWVLLTVALGKALLDGAASWVMYLAVEPYARRLHARFLVAWNRLLVHGRLRDPLVGRDILYGVALSTVWVLSWAQLPIILPHALGLAAPPPPMFFPLGNIPFLFFLNAPVPEPLLGGRYVLEAVADVVLTAFGLGMGFLIVILGLRVLLRRFWAAVVVFAVVQLAMNPMVEAADYSVISIACWLVSFLSFVSALRFGLVGSLALWFSVTMWMNFPVTANVAAPHFGTGLVAVLVIAGLGTFGAVNASRRLRSVV